jgi:hypothetical protein
MIHSINSFCERQIKMDFETQVSSKTMKEPGSLWGKKVFDGASEKRKASDCA